MEHQRWILVVELDGPPAGATNLNVAQALEAAVAGAKVGKDSLRAVVKHSVNLDPREVVASFHPDHPGRPYQITD